jgi:hypothetical protein
MALASMGLTTGLSMSPLHDVSVVVVPQTERITAIIQRLNFFIRFTIQLKICINLPAKLQIKIGK